MPNKKEVTIRSCKACLVGVFDGGCDLTWGHAGLHKHNASGHEWEAYKQPCGHPWCFIVCQTAVAQKSKKLEKAKKLARGTCRPATLAIKFGVAKEQIVDALAQALLPFVQEKP